MVTGLGGVFIKAKDPKFLARWYEDNLSIGFGQSVYFSFKWRELNNADKIGNTVFCFFKDNTDYFYPSESDMMINFRVENLDELRIKLKKVGIVVVDKVETFDYGRFGWAMDPEGNKIEMWEPIDSGFEESNTPFEANKVTGLGGAFLKCKEPEELMNWYANHFGLFFSYSSHTFQWNDLNKMNHIGHTVFSFFPMKSEYFKPSEKKFMLNFRVQNLDKLIEELRTSEVDIIGDTQEFEYGKFGWITDPEGNKIELWEPVDEKFVF